MTGWSLALLGAVLLAAVNTLGDFVWARYVPGHRVVFGLLHGTLLLMVAGLYLGLLRGRPVAGTAGGAAVGLGAAAGFYLLARFIGYSAMFVAWMALWIGFALLDAVLRRLAAADRGPQGDTCRGWLRRGVLRDLRHLDTPLAGRARLRIPLRVLDARFPTRLPGAAREPADPGD